MKQKRELLEMALVGYQRQAEIIQQKIAEIRGQLGGGAVPKVGRATKPGKRQMTPEGRARIAAATKARWAEYRKKKSQAA